MKRKRGYTLIETVTAAGLSVLAFLGGTFMFLSGMMSWARGQGRIDAEATTNRAVREISRELREAMSVSVDANGLGLSYRLPVKDSSGTYVNPITWDGVTRRIQLDGSVLEVTGSGTHVICPGVSLTDPNSNNSSYRIFTPGSGNITRSLTVLLVSRRQADYNKLATSRSREVIYLRNIPELEN